MVKNLFKRDSIQADKNSKMNKSTKSAIRGEGLCPPIPIDNDQLVLNILMGKRYKIKLSHDGEWGDFVSVEEVRDSRCVECCIWHEGTWKGAYAGELYSLGLAP